MSECDPDLIYHTSIPMIVEAINRHRECHHRRPSLVWVGDGTLEFMEMNCEEAVVMGVKVKSTDVMPRMTAMTMELSSH